MMGQKLEGIDVNFFGGVGGKGEECVPMSTKTHYYHSKSFLWGIFETSQILVRDVFETSQRRHKKDIFFEICSRRLKDVI